MKTVLILYFTTDNHTKKIAMHMQKRLETSHVNVTLRQIDDASDLEAFDTVVIGASIRYGKHDKSVYQFIEKNRAVLERKPNAFFSVNIVARKPEKNRPDTNPYLIKFLKQIAWKPQNLAVFGGKLDYPSYRYFDKQMIRLIMWMTKGPTDPQSVIEFTDWDEVDNFAAMIGKL